MVPVVPDSVSYESNRTVVLSAGGAPELTVSTQWSIEKSLPIQTKALKEGFARTFLELIPPGFTFQDFEYSFRVFGGYMEKESLSFAYPETVSVYSLWKRPEFLKMNKDVQEFRITDVVLRLRGWTDSVYTTPFDDPGAEGNSLYKLQIGLIPGDNDVYFSTGSKSEALLFSTKFVPEAVPAADRADGFHGSQLAEGCATCHSGLVDADSASLPNEECVTCHGGMKAGYHIHGPVEMDECNSCHQKSAGTNVVEVPEGVPGSCAACHEEKVSAVENAPVPHAVAGECLTCHSPHSSDREHLLKTDIFTLCTGCHGEYTINHPVGKHPLRYSVIEGTNDEISCASCHNPHGSENSALLRVGGGRMAICLQCHQK